MNTLEARRRLLGRNVYKRTTEGNPAIAQGSLARMYPGIEMQGWTEQPQYEGKNLSYLEIGAYSATNTDKVNNDTRARIFEPLNPTGDIVISIATGFQIFCRKLLENTLVQELGWDAGPVKISKEDRFDAITVVVRKTDDSDWSSEDLSKTNFQIEYGTSATAYEPYTGGAPSPSPDYPQPITNAGKYNEETGKWEYEVKLTGANLFDYSPFVNDDGYITSSYSTSKQVSSPFHVKEGEKYVLITKGTKAVVTDYSSIYFGEDDLSYSDNNSKVLKTGLNYNAFDDGVQRRYVMTATKTCDITKCIVHSANYRANAYIVEEFGLFNYIDGVSENYEPYHTPQTVTLTADRPLTKWDRLEKRGGQWGWVYKSNTVTLDGSEVWQVYGSGFHTPRALLETYTRTHGVCEQGDVKAYDSTDGVYGQNSIWLGVNNSNIYWNENPYFNVELEDSGIENWKNHLSQNPAVIWYETAAETFVPLTASEQEAMNALHTFRPTTVLSNDCECNMSLTYKTKKSMGG